MVVLKLFLNITSLQTILWLFRFVLSCSGLSPPLCNFLPTNPQIGDTITLNCMSSANDTAVDFDWYHDGDIISDDFGGIERVKLSQRDIGVLFTCKASAYNEEPQNCDVQPLQPPDDLDSHDDPIKYIFIGIFALGGLLIVCLILACIVWLARRTRPTRSYSLTERPRSNSFDDFDAEAAVDNRPAAPLPKAKQSSVQSNSPNGNAPTDIPKSFMEPPPPAPQSADSIYMNTARLAQEGSSTLPVASSSKGAGGHIYLVPKSTPVSSEDDLTKNDDSKLYANMPIGSPRASSTLPHFKY